MIQHTPLGIFKKKRSELRKENFVLLKHRFWRQIDALLPHFHSQTPTDTIFLAPKEWSPPSLPYVSKGTLKTVNPGSVGHLLGFFPSAEAIHRLCKRLEHSKIWNFSFFFFFFFFLFSFFFSFFFFSFFLLSWEILSSKWLLCDTQWPLPCEVSDEAKEIAKPTPVGGHIWQPVSLSFWFFFK